jgi:hypothetical protein
VARTPAEILTSFAGSVALSDDTVDTAKGPMFGLIGNPLAQVLSPTEVAVDTLNQTFSVAFALTATQAQAQAFITNWGETAGTGNPSTCLVYFMKFSSPGVNDIFTVNVGDLVSNSDQSLQYVVMEAGSIIGSSAQSYYNASRRTWEIALLVQAVANGPQYDLPATRINNIVNQITGIDACENRVDAAGGIVAETQVAQIERAQEKLLGLDLNSPQGNVSRVKAFNPAVIQDVQIALSSNRQIFKRISYTPAADYYVLGTLPQTITETYTSQSGGETLLPLKNVPSLSINTVTINGVPITNFALVSDTSLQLGGSARAADKVQISPALMTGDVVQINQTFDALFQQLQTNVFSSLTQMFQTDELARAFVQTPVVISLTGKALTGYGATTVQLAVQAALQAFLEPGYWQNEYQPNDALEYLKTNVQGLSNPVLQIFQSSVGALSSIETAVFLLNQIANYDPDFVTILIKSS